MKVKRVVAGVLGAIVLAAGSALPVMASGDLCADFAGDPEKLAAAGCPTATGNKTVGDVANEVIQFVLGFMGLLAVGVMVYGGIMYTTSTGDAAKVMKAKRTLMYGLVGLVVALLAFAIVRFVPKILG